MMVALPAVLLSKKSRILLLVMVALPAVLPLLKLREASVGDAGTGGCARGIEIYGAVGSSG